MGFDNQYVANPLSQTVLVNSVNVTVSLQHWEDLSLKLVTMTIASDLS